MFSLKPYQFLFKPIFYFFRPKFPNRIQVSQFQFSSVNNSSFSPLSHLKFSLPKLHPTISANCILSLSVNCKAFNYFTILSHTQQFVSFIFGFPNFMSPLVSNNSWMQYIYANNFSLLLLLWLLFHTAEFALSVLFTQALCFDVALTHNVPAALHLSLYTRCVFQIARVYNMQPTCFLPAWTNGSIFSLSYVRSVNCSQNNFLIIILSHK